MKNFSLSLMIAGAMIWSFSACSQQTSSLSNNQQTPPTNQQAKPPKGERPQFSDLLAHMDTNKDGKLAKTEVKGPLQKDFDKVDKDQDGFISEAEFKNAPPPRRGKERS